MEFFYFACSLNIHAKVKDFTSVDKKKIISTSWPVSFKKVFLIMEQTQEENTFPQYNWAAKSPKRVFVKIVTALHNTESLHDFHVTDT